MQTTYTARKTGIAAAIFLAGAVVILAPAGAGSWPLGIVVHGVLAACVGAAGALAYLGRPELGGIAIFGVAIPAVLLWMFLAIG